MLERGFDPAGTVEVVVDFDPDAEMSFWDVVEVQEQMADLLGRPWSWSKPMGLATLCAAGRSFEPGSWFMRPDDPGAARKSTLDS